MSTNQPASPSYLTRVRNVPLLPDERVACAFSASRGFIPEPIGQGHLLMLTDRRVISFSEQEGAGQSFFIPLEELRGVTVRRGSRNSLSMFQWLFTIVAGLVVYVAASYWVTGRIQGPNVPVINIDLGPLLVLVAVLAAGWTVVRNYFTGSVGAINFQGAAWAFSFPYNQDRAGREVNQLINRLFELSCSANHEARPPVSPNESGNS